MKYKITENFLPPNQFRDIQDVFMGMEIPWNCIDGVVMPGGKNIKAISAEIGRASCRERV